MKIGVISDTHIQNPSRSLPQRVHEIFKDVDMIIHAGDVMIEEVLMELETIAPVQAVAGNNDSWEFYNKYGPRRIIEVNGRRIGVTHGYGRGRTLFNAYAEFLEDKLDCIIFGHSHAPHNEVMEDILFFNPGSPTNKRMQRQYSVGILHVPERDTKEDIYGEIIYFE